MPKLKIDMIPELPIHSQNAYEINANTNTIVVFINILVAMYAHDIPIKILITKA